MLRTLSGKSQNSFVTKTALNLNGPDRRILPAKLTNHGMCTTQYMRDILMELTVGYYCKVISNVEQICMYCKTLFFLFQTFATLNERFSSMSQSQNIRTIVVD